MPDIDFDIARRFVLEHLFDLEAVDIRPPQPVVDHQQRSDGHLAGRRFGCEGILVNAGQFGELAFELAAIFKQERLPERLGGKRHEQEQQNCESPWLSSIAAI